MSRIVHEEEVLLENSPFDKYLKSLENSHDHIKSTEYEKYHRHDIVSKDKRDINTVRSHLPRLWLVCTPLTRFLHGDTVDRLVDRLLRKLSITISALFLSPEAIQEEENDYDVLGTEHGVLKQFIERFPDIGTAAKYLDLAHKSVVAAIALVVLCSFVGITDSSLFGWTSAWFIALLIVACIAERVLYRGKKIATILQVHQQQIKLTQELRNAIEQFDSQFSKCIRHIKEVELVSKGYRLYAPFAPIERIELSSLHRQGSNDSTRGMYCRDLRLALHKSLSNLKAHLESMLESKRVSNAGYDAVEGLRKQAEQFSIVGLKLQHSRVCELRLMLLDGICNACNQQRSNADGPAPISLPSKGGIGAESLTKTELFFGLPRLLDDITKQMLVEKSRISRALENSLSGPTTTTTPAASKQDIEYTRFCSQIKTELNEINAKFLLLQQKVADATRQPTSATEGEDGHQIPVADIFDLYRDIQNATLELVNSFQRGKRTVEALLHCDTKLTQPPQSARQQSTPKEEMTSKLTGDSYEDAGDRHDTEETKQQVPAEDGEVTVYTFAVDDANVEDEVAQPKAMFGLPPLPVGLRRQAVDESDGSDEEHSVDEADLSDSSPLAKMPQRQQILDDSDEEEGAPQPGQMPLLGELKGVLKMRKPKITKTIVVPE